jgi:hypothetical protein
MNVNKFPMVRRYVVKPFAYDITFSIDRILEKGTIVDNIIVPMDTDLGGQDKSVEESSRDDDEAARTAKKLKASDSGTSNSGGKVDGEMPAVITTELGMVVIPEFDKVINLRDTKLSDMS